MILHIIQYHKGNNGIVNTNSQTNSQICGEVNKLGVTRDPDQYPPFNHPTPGPGTAEYPKMPHFL